MFHVCKSCADGCESCSKGCDRFCKTSNVVCGCICSLAACFSQVCVPLVLLCDRPLGGYVIMTLLFNIPAAIMAGVSLVNDGVKACTEAPLMVSNGANAGLGVVHAAFAIYLQQRIVCLLRETGEGADQDASAEDLMKRAWELVLYDVGFCIYILIFIGSAGFNFLALTWPQRCNMGRGLGSNNLPSLASLLLLMFAFAAVMFGLLWWLALKCQDCCCCSVAQVVLGRAYARPAQGRPVQAQGQVVGQPVWSAQPPVAQVMQPAATAQAQPQPAQVYAPPAGQPAPSGGANTISAAEVGAAASAATAQGLQMAGKWLDKKGGAMQGGRT